jgi:ankyrin repeat protein
MDIYEHPKYLDADEQPLIDAIQKYGPNTPVDTMNARLLHYAVSNNYYKTILILLAQGASVNIQDSSGNIPLHDAVFLHNFELVTLLLDHGADPLSANHYDVSPLNLASEDQKIYVLLWKKITSTKKLNVPFHASL